MEKRINRTVHIDGEYYKTGEEDAMLEHLQAQDDKIEGHDHEKELTRMEKGGFIEGFVDLDDEDRENAEDENGNADLRANKRAQVQERQEAKRRASRKKKTEEE